MLPEFFLDKVAESFYTVISDLSCNVSEGYVTHRWGEIHPGVKFQLGVNFFWDTGTFHLRSKTENFHPKVKWIFWPFCMIFYMFSFYKNTDILISYNWQKMSDKWYYKL